MPLSKVGKDILKHFKEEYGKKEGTSNFYASVRAGKVTPKAFEKGAPERARAAKAKRKTRRKKRRSKK